jgi:hypothetical protein
MPVGQMVFDKKTWHEVLVWSGSASIRGRLHTVDLLIKVACFVRQVYNIFRMQMN